MARSSLTAPPRRPSTRRRTRTGPASCPRTCSRTSTSTSSRRSRQVRCSSTRRAIRRRSIRTRRSSAAFPRPAAARRARSSSAARALGWPREAPDDRPRTRRRRARARGSGACGSLDKGSSGGDTTRGKLTSSTTTTTTPAKDLPQPKSGVVQIDGDFNGTLTHQVNTKFSQKSNRNGVAVQVDERGTDDQTGFADLCDGNTDIAVSSRRITDAELSACTDNGLQVVDFPVAYDAIVDRDRERARRRRRLRQPDPAPADVRRRLAGQRRGTSSTRTSSCCGSARAGPQDGTPDFDYFGSRVLGVPDPTLANYRLELPAVQARDVAGQELRRRTRGRRRLPQGRQGRQERRREAAEREARAAPLHARARARDEGVQEGRPPARQGGQAARRDGQGAEPGGPGGSRSRFTTRRSAYGSAPSTSTRSRRSARRRHPRSSRSWAARLAKRPSDSAARIGWCRPAPSASSPSPSTSSGRRSCGRSRSTARPATAACSRPRRRSRASSTRSSARSGSTRRSAACSRPEVQTYIAYHLNQAAALAKQLDLIPTAGCDQAGGAAADP